MDFEEIKKNKTRAALIECVRFALLGINNTYSQSRALSLFRDGFPDWLLSLVKWTCINEVDFQECKHKPCGFCFNYGNFNDDHSVMCVGCPFIKIFDCTREKDSPFDAMKPIEILGHIEEYIKENKLWESIGYGD